MKLKFLTISGAAAALLIAASPMVSTSMSTDNGGTKLAIDAYTDGGGVLLINQASDSKVDNSAMNKLVFKYGDAAKSSNTTLKNQVNVLSPGATVLEKADATSKIELAKIVINPPVDGSSCTDNNVQTINDVYVSGSCVGTSVPNGSICDDGNAATVGEKWLNGVCQGGIVGTLAGNGLFYDNCEGGSKHWTDASAYCAAKGAGWRLPTIGETVASLGAAGIPSCGFTWTSNPGIGINDASYVWNGATSYNSGVGYWNSFTGVNSVRCVK